MALYPYHPDGPPLGQFDVLDSYQSSILGGEVGTFYAAGRTNTSTEKAAGDVLDGYTNTTDVQRPAVANRINASTQRPLFLLDEGTTNYGTLFGQVIGTPAGLSTTGTNLGPHTAAASGKVTCWRSGVYGVSVDAVDDSADGLSIDNASCDPGAALDVQSDGKLTLSGSGTAVGVTVGSFIEFETRPSLVTTPASLVGAAEAATRVVIRFLDL